MNKKEVYTPLEVAQLCGLSRRRVYDWLSWGWLRGHREGSRWMVQAEDWTFFLRTSRGARPCLVPALYDWSSLWQNQSSLEKASSSDASSCD